MRDTSKWFDWNSLPPDEALFVAVCVSDEDAVEAALKRGADVQCRSPAGRAPLLFPAVGNLQGTARAGRWYDEPKPGAREGRPTRRPLGSERPTAPERILSRLLTIGADVNAVDEKYGATALHWIAMHDVNPDAARALLAAGADINARDKAGRRPIEWAKDHGSVEMAKFLIAAGADVTAIEVSWVNMIRKRSPDERVPPR